MQLHIKNAFIAQMLCNHIKVSASLWSSFGFTGMYLKWTWIHIASKSSKSGSYVWFSSSSGTLDRNLAAKLTTTGSILLLDLNGYPRNVCNVFVAKINSRAAFAVCFYLHTAWRTQPGGLVAKCSDFQLTQNYAADCGTRVNLSQCCQTQNF